MNSASVPSPPPPPPAPAIRAPRSWGALVAQLALRAAVNPRLGLDLVRTAWSFRRRAWWKTAPFLPVPDRKYLRWRMETAYADPEAIPPVEDVIRFARWRRTTIGV